MIRATAIGIPITEVNRATTIVLQHQGEGDTLYLSSKLFMHFLFCFGEGDKHNTFVYNLPNQQTFHFLLFIPFTKYFNSKNFPMYGQYTLGHS